MTYSEDLKWRVISLVFKDKSVNEVAEILDMSVPTIYRVLQIYDHYGTVIDPWAKKQGRHLELDERLVDVSHYLSSSYPPVLDKHIARTEKGLVSCGAQA